MGTLPRLSSAFEAINKAFEEERAALLLEKEKVEAEKQSFLEESTKERTQIESKKRKFEEEKKQMCQVLVGDDDIITLNVGGSKFVVKRSTLTQIQGSMLESMFSGRWESKLDRDKEGNVFLDFNPYCFGKVIDYLRSLKISGPNTPLPVISEEERGNFESLLNFLGLTELLDVAGPSNKSDVFEMTDNLTILDDGKAVEKQGVDCNGWVKGRKIVTEGVYTWRLKIEFFDYWIFFGVCNTKKGENTYHHLFLGPSCFGWTNSSHIRAGHPTRFPTDFHSGQIVELTLDCEKRLLTLSLDGKKLKVEHTLPIENSWQLHLWLCRAPTKVSIL